MAISSLSGSWARCQFSCYELDHGSQADEVCLLQGSYSHHQSQSNDPSLKPRRLSMATLLFIYLLESDQCIRRGFVVDIPLLLEILWGNQRLKLKFNFGLSSDIVRVIEPT